MPENGQTPEADPICLRGLPTTPNILPGTLGWRLKSGTQTNERWAAMSSTRIQGPSQKLANRDIKSEASANLRESTEAS